MIWSMTAVWLVIIIVFAIIEVVTVRLLTLGMVIGAIAALVLACIGLPLWLQILVFIVTAIVFLVLIRPFALKFFSMEKNKNRGEKLIGRSVIVLSEIDNKHGVGRVTVDGTNWMARSVRDRDVIPTGSVVRVVDSDGSKLIVKKVM